MNLRISWAVTISRLALLIPFAAYASDAPQDPLESLATALQKGDARGAIELFDPQTPSYAELKRDIEALSALPNNYCTLAITKTTQTSDTIRFEADWSLETYTVQNGPQLDRRDRVEIGVRRVGDVWKIVSFSPASVLQPPDDTIFKRVALLASGLNDKDESGALGVFDSHMKQFGEIDNDIDALVSQNDLLCAIDIVSDKQTGGTHTLDLDWYFQLKSRADAGSSEQRRERVQVVMQQVGGKWKITKMDSLKILSPEIQGTP